MKKLLSLFIAAVLIFSCSAVSLTALAVSPKIGDINGDNAINSIDALELLMMVVGLTEKTDTTMEIGDIDRNGSLDSSDALLILQHSVGLEFHVQGIRIDKKDMTCKIGDSFTVTGAAYPAFAENTEIKWKTSDESVATVNENGLVTVVGNGGCKISCVSDENEKISASFAIFSGIKATSVSLNKKSDSVPMGSTVQLKATVKPDNAYSENFTWKSSDSTVATVDKNGKVSARSMGSATITCTTVDGSNKSASYSITVNMMSVPYVNQLNDYPTGCEAASACMLLKYYGYSITMKQMVDIIPRENLEYKNGKWYGPDINEKFVGDPRYGYRSTIRGYGAFSPVITKSLQDAIDQRNGSHVAKNISGCSFDELLNTVSDGHPAVVWATYNMQDPTEVNAWYIRDTGKYFEYPKGTHVMVLCGYDKNNVYIMDPYNYSTAKKFTKDSFKKHWELLNNQAIILEKK